MNSPYQWALKFRIVWVVIAAFAVFSSAPPPLEAALISSQLSDGQIVSERNTDLETVRQALEHQLVAQRLADYGFSKEEVQLKLQSLSDTQLHQLASVADDLAAGADGLGIVVTVLVIVLLVILILKLSNKEIIVR